MMELKPCPACNSEHVHLTQPIHGYYVRCEECFMSGPTGDPDGSKWNAMPRRGDAAEIERLRNALEDSTYILTGVIDHESNELGMIDDQIAHNFSTLKGGQECTD